MSCLLFWLLTNHLSCLSGDYLIHGWNEMSCLLFWLLTNHLSCLSGVTVFYTWLEWDVDKPPVLS